MNVPMVGDEFYPVFVTDGSGKPRWGFEIVMPTATVDEDMLVICSDLGDGVFHVKGVLTNAEMRHLVRYVVQERM